MKIEWEGSSAFFFFSSRRRHTRFDCDWSSDVCSSDLQALVDLVRMGGGEPLDVADVDRLVSQEEQGPTGRTADGEYKIILPGLRRVIQAKTAGQREYLQAIAQHDIVIGIGPAGTGETHPAG